MYRKCLAIAALLLLAASAASAQTDSSFTFPDSPTGQCVRAYFDAYASGTEAMREFSLKCVSEEALNRRPMDERLQMYTQMKGQLGDIRPYRLLMADSGSMNILVRGANDQWFTFSFQFEPVPPHKLLGIRIEQADSTAANELTTPMTQQQFLDSLRSRMQQMGNEDKFSGVVLVAKDNIIIFEQAYGLADKSFGVPNRIDTKFNLGSINKIFTKIAIGQLVQQGKIGFDDTLGSFLPDYPNADARSKVTVRQLLNMTSGVGDFFGKKFVETPKTLFRSNDDFLPMFDSLPLAFEPGTQQKYSNGGYILLGAIVQKVSGMPYYDYVRQHIYSPCGMHNTDWYAADSVVENLAEGYARPNDSADGYISNIYTRPARGSAAGGDIRLPRICSNS